MSHIDLARLREDLAKGRVGIWLTGHADVEMRKDGITATGVERTVLEGERSWRVSGLRTTLIGIVACYLALPRRTECPFTFALSAREADPR